MTEKKGFLIRVIGNGETPMGREEGYTDLMVTTAEPIEIDEYGVIIFQTVSGEMVGCTGFLPLYDTLLFPNGPAGRSAKVKPATAPLAAIVADCRRPGGGFFWSNE
jgi:hypothetical protein